MSALIAAWALWYEAIVRKLAEFRASYANDADV